MWIAGYGPKALAVAGRVADGVIIQLADPEIISWIMDTARKAAEEAGRDPSQLKCIVGAPSHVTDDLADAREQVRWFPAMVSNHVMDLIERYGTDGSSVPKALTDYVQARKFYDYNEHSRVGAKHGEFVTDEICDRFCVLGNDRPDQGEAEGARGRRRRPVQHLPDDPRPGGDAQGLRRTRSSPTSPASLPDLSRACRSALAARDAAGGAALVLARRGAPARRLEPRVDAAALRAAGARRRARAADALRRAGLRLLPAGRPDPRRDRRGRQRARRSCTCSRTTARLEPLVVDPRFVHRTPHAGGNVLAYSTNRRNGVDFDIVARDLTTGEERVFELGGNCSVEGVSPDGRCDRRRTGRASAAATTTSSSLRRADRRGRRMLTPHDERGRVLLAGVARRADSSCSTNDEPRHVRDRASTACSCASRHGISTAASTTPAAACSCSRTRTATRG